MLNGSVEDAKILIMRVSEREGLLGFGLACKAVHLCNDLRRHLHVRPSEVIDVASYGQAYAIITFAIVAWPCGNGSTHA